MIPPRSRFGIAARAAVMILTASVLVAGAMATYQLALPGWSVMATAALAVATSFLPIFVLNRYVAMRGVRQTIHAVSDGLLSLTEHDYSLRLAALRNDEVGQLVHRFNALAERLRRERSDIYQKEILLETVLGATSMSVVIVNEAMRVVYSNGAARQFFGIGKKLEGMDLAAILAEAPADVQEAAKSPTDVLFTCDRPGREPETFHLSKRYFELSTQPHTVFLMKPLTKEIARKEVETWKKAIRVLSHELNNSLAPVTSLVASARMMVGNPDHRERLAKALDTIEERATHLTTFLDGYASFARLPTPRKKPVTWTELLAGVEGLYPFKVLGAMPTEPVMVDPAQMQQVLINLLKNAVESGSPADEVAVTFVSGGSDGVELQVLDRGKGMPEEVMKSALLPFYSTKKTGSGLGLALCREIVDAHGGRLSLHPRDGGGVVVRCWLPRSLAVAA